MSTLTQATGIPAALLNLARPKQWAKNLLVFTAIIFAGKISQTPLLINTIIAFIGMCLISSATYVANDLADSSRDREHPTKKNRPIASGIISPPTAIFYTTLLLSTGLALLFYTGLWCLAIGGIYILIQILYNVKLKHVPIIDVFIIAAGFVLRAALGAQAIHVPISGWMFIVTGVLALTLGFAKRRNEFILMGENRASSRESLNEYSKSTLDMLVMLFAGMSCMAYLLYTMDSTTAKSNPGIILTTPMVLYGVARYIQRVFKDDEGGEPADILFRDPHILIAVLLFVVVAILTVTTSAHVPIIEST
ncbi:MAG: decaprenyl-phosphate phosphoribosyltransferase [Fimbriimonadaceae bacterium]